MMQERGLTTHASTIYRWVLQYSPILSNNIRKRLRTTNDSWRMDETHLKIRGKDMYLYCAVDSFGNTPFNDTKRTSWLINITDEVILINQLLGVA